MDRRWSRWTWPRGLVAVGWIVATALSSLYYWYIWAAGTAKLFGVPPGALALRSGARSVLLAGVLTGLGPFGVWLFRRRAAWLVAAVSFFVLGTGLAARDIWRSVDAVSQGMR